MECKNLSISFNKGGSGGVSPRISLPISFLRDMGITENQNTISVYYNKNSKEIKIKKNNLYLLRNAEEMLQKLELRSTQGNTRRSIKGHLNSVLTKCYNSGLDIEYLAVKYDIIKSIDVYETSSGGKAIIVCFENNYKFKEG